MTNLVFTFDWLNTMHVPTFFSLGVVADLIGVLGLPRAHTGGAENWGSSNLPRSMLQVLQTKSHAPIVSSIAALLLRTPTPKSWVTVAVIFDKCGIAGSSPKCACSTQRPISFATFGATMSRFTPFYRIDGIQSRCHSKT